MALAAVESNLGPICATQSSGARDGAQVHAINHVIFIGSSSENDFTFFPGATKLVAVLGRKVSTRMARTVGKLRRKKKRRTMGSFIAVELANIVRSGVCKNLEGRSGNGRRKEMGERAKGRS